MTKTYIKTYTNTFNIRGKEITITAPARFDSKTDKLVDDMELDDKAVELAQAKFREKYRYISPDELKGLRNKWHLSQRNFAKVVGWSPSTVALYEAGEIPTAGNNRLLKILIRDSRVMEEFIEESKKDDDLEL